MRALDGGTSEKFALKSPNESTLNHDQKELDVISFNRFQTPNFQWLQITRPKMCDSYKLDKNHTFLYKICQGVMLDNLPIELASKKPKPLSNARWGTIANALVCKYASTPSFSKQFQDFVHGIIHFYALVFRSKLVQKHR